MKKNFWVILSILAFALSACGQANTAESIPTISLNGGQTSSSAQTNSGDSVSAAGTIVPRAEARLSFTGIGRVASVNVQVGDVVEAGQVLVELDTAILEAKVNEAESNLAVAEIQVKYLIRMGTDEKHLELAEADVARAQALVDSANATLNAQSHLTAPFAGTVVTVDISPAETVSPGKVVIVLGDLGGFRIETTDLSERDVPNVKIGQAASVFVEALNEEFTGKVTDVSRISTTLGGDVVFKVTIDFDQQPAGLLWGMSADVEIFVGN
ncbi:MAG: HlyD family efflux transporter periplasmic adaptor subunit [Chloroflexi bacterium]|nr:HlyD family efflux transporter periplasmic adaptor subunit [Chloroflexota bacterium]